MYPFYPDAEWHLENSSVYLVIMGPHLDFQFSEKVKVTAKRYIIDKEFLCLKYTFAKNYVRN